MTRWAIHWGSLHQKQTNPCKETFCNQLGIIFVEKTHYYHIICFTFTLKHYRYQYIRKKIQISGNKLNLDDGRSGLTYATEAYCNTKEFIQKYARHFGDDQPDAYEIHLPSCVTKKLVFSDYTLYCISNGLKCVKLSRFLQIWRTKFPNLKVRKVLFN